ncbi:hypothetical protein BCEP4_1540007 [Burkholderia cepacia]|nr:hypothetical protein BCEP4_1540007 [Burkholderia cepacia]
MNAQRETPIKNRQTKFHHRAGPPHDQAVYPIDARDQEFSLRPRHLAWH